MSPPRDEALERAVYVAWEDAGGDSTLLAFTLVARVRELEAAIRTHREVVHDDSFHASDDYAALADLALWAVLGEP